MHQAADASSLRPRLGGVHIRHVSLCRNHAKTSPSSVCDPIPLADPNICQCTRCQPQVVLTQPDPMLPGAPLRWTPRHLKLTRSAACCQVPSVDMSRQDWSESTPRFAPHARIGDEQRGFWRSSRRRRPAHDGQGPLSSRHSESTSGRKSSICHEGRNCGEGRLCAALPPAAMPRGSAPPDPPAPRARRAGSPARSRGG